MHDHNYARGLVREHPAISGLQRFLQSRRLPAATVNFFTRHTYFAYPRTLWIKLAVDESDKLAEIDLARRHSFDPEPTGRAFGEWLIKTPAIRNIVFDLTDVTIFDAKRMLGLFVATAAEPGGGKFYVCQGELAENVRELLTASDATIFRSEEDLLAHLREAPRSQRCVVKLPPIVDLFSLDATMREQAPRKHLRKYDVIAFDMADVLRISFDAHAMLSPIIHSLAHQYGILATCYGARSKVRRDMMEHGSLRAMRFNLIQVTQDYVERLDPPMGSGNLLSMRTFTRDETAELQHLCLDRLDQMLKNYGEWFVRVGKIPRRLGQTSVERFLPVVTSLRNIIKELVDNVAGHANGLGYVMMELNRERGLSIYVGDTGIGLARGIQRSYRIKKPGDLEAVKMAMQLGDQLPNRRRLRGTLAFGGRGLEHVGLILRKFSGTIAVRTGTAMAAFSPAKDREPYQLHPVMYDIQGTHIHINIPTREA